MESKAGYPEFEKDLDSLSQIPYKAQKKILNIKRSPLYLKLEGMEKKIDNLEKELKMLVVSFKNESLKNRFARRPQYINNIEPRNDDRRNTH